MWPSSDVTLPLIGRLPRECVGLIANIVGVWRGTQDRWVDCVEFMNGWFYYEHGRERRCKRRRLRRNGRRLDHCSVCDGITGFDRYAVFLK